MLPDSTPLSPETRGRHDTEARTAATAVEGCQRSILRVAPVPSMGSEKANRLVNTPAAGLDSGSYLQ